MNSGGSQPLINPIVRKAWESALQASSAELATWIHGDLHPQNVVVKDGELSGVIDWADIAAGDCATDLATVWMLLPTVAARESAIEEYGSIPAATWSRALGWAINLGSLLLETGLAEDSRLAKIGELTLQRIVAGPHWT
jgi:aminoglycoside phosphotransferase (APT) family kinase protein